MNRRSVLRVLGLSAIGLAGGLAGCSSMDAPPEPPGLAEAGEYVLGPGDAVRVVVYGEEQLSGEFRVDGSGSLAMPLVGQIPVKGKTTRDLEKDLAKRLERGYVKNAKVSAEVINFRPFFILGEVRNPGQYPYVSGMTVLSAVAAAGGYTYRAQDKYVLVTRGRDPSKTMYKAPITAPVLPDDVVRVPERYF
jgi:polysaccharide export outer membrane protein